MPSRRLTWLLTFSAFMVCCLLGQAAAKKATADEPPALVVVELRSDGQTYVSILNKLPPARFKTKTIKLAPGQYTAKGARRGYKNETVNFIVVPDMNPNTVTVVCVDK